MYVELITCHNVCVAVDELEEVLQTPQTAEHALQNQGRNYVLRGPESNKQN